MEWWDGERLNRLQADDRASGRVEYYESPSGNVAWIAGEFIVDAQQADLIGLDDREHAGQPLAQVPVAHLDDRLRLYRTGVDDRAVDFLTYVHSLRLEIREGGQEPVIGAHYVLTGEMKATVPRGGPASAPFVAGPVQAPASWGAGEPLVAVVDTGIDETASWSSAVAHGDRDVDRLFTTGDSLGSQAGHGTFIASLIERMAGGDVPLRAVGVLDIDGAASEIDVVRGLSELRERDDSIRLLVVNMSLGGFTDNGGWVPENERDAVFPASDRDRMPVGLAAELSKWAADRADTVFVACAGNDGHNRRFWPAALADTSLEAGLARPLFVSVGSVDRTLAASHFTNRGHWVKISTLGEDLVSDYPLGRFPLTQQYAEVFTVRAARWSGTSFAAPLVTAEIVRRCLEDPNGGTSPAKAWGDLQGTLPPAPVGAGVPPIGQIWDPRSGISGPVRDPRLP